MSNGIQIHHGALDESPDGDIVLRGVIHQGALGIHPDSPALIQKFFQINEGSHGAFMVDDYQREVLSGKKHTELVKAFKEGQRFPDVELGMRGRTFEHNKGVFTLKDPVFVVDGLQRIASAREALEMTNDGITIRLGATIYFDSTDEWERSRFRTLNIERTKLSPNVHLRNMRPSNKAVAALYELTTRPGDFPLYNRVQWGQAKNRQEFLTALGLVSILTMLHHRFGHGARNSSAENQARSLNATLDDIGVRKLTANTKTFFGVIDDVWGIRRIAYRDQATHVKQGFLLVLAEILTRHAVFWEDRQLKIDRLTTQKLGKFPIADPSVINLVSSTGAGSRRMLYQMLLDHINSGRRQNRLIEDINQPDEEPEKSCDD